MSYSTKKMKFPYFATLIVIIAIRSTRLKEPTEDAVERILRRKDLKPPSSVGTMKEKSNEKDAASCSDVSVSSRDVNHAWKLILTSIATNPFPLILHGYGFKLIDSLYVFEVSLLITKSTL